MRDEKEMKRVFYSGYDSGREEGIQEGLRMNFNQSETLDDVTYKKVIDFLVSEGVELVCYDVQQGGLRIKRAEVKRRNYNQNR